MNPQSSAAVRPGPRGGLVLPLVLGGLLLVWLVTPAAWLLASGFASPHSGVEPTAAQVRAQGWVNLIAAVTGQIIPAAVLVVAWPARRPVLAALGGLAFLTSNAVLLFLGILPWQLISYSIDMIVTGRSASLTP